MSNAERPQPNPGWYRKAACKPKDQVLFFSRSLSQKQIDERNELCNTKCPVKADCLKDALYYGDIETYRAGRTPTQLREEWSDRGLQRERKKRLK